MGEVNELVWSRGGESTEGRRGEGGREEAEEEIRADGGKEGGKMEGDRWKKKREGGEYVNCQGGWKYLMSVLFME